MLEDRDYMRADYSGGGRWRFNWSMTGILMVTLMVAFVLQAFLRRSPIMGYLVLSVDGLKHGYIWQLVTFQFLHGSVWHLFGNLITLWFFGRAVEQRLGPSGMLRVYLLCGVMGGILQALLGLIFPHAYPDFGVVGASAGTAGMIAVFAMMQPDGIILLSFIFPIRAKYLLWGSLAISFLFTIAPPGDGIAHAAHLGGLLFGWLYMVGGLQNVRSWAEFSPMRGRQRKRQLVQTAAKTSYWRKPKPQTPVELPPAEFISKEVDPILEKISAHGIQSLTERERKILEAARSKMAKR